MVITMDNRPIGVMDSGLGGLSVVRELHQRLPHEQLVFLGDQGHFPYGTKSSARVQQLASAIGRFLLHQDVKMMIIACNTATAAALPTLRTQLPIPVIGVIHPGAAAAVATDPTGPIGVIATTATTKAGAYPREIAALRPQTPVVAVAAQELVDIVEHGQTDTPAAQRTVDRALAPYRERPVRTLILGCTHFPFLAPEIHRALGPSVRLIDPAQETVASATRWLAAHAALGNHAHPVDRLYSTGKLTDLQAGVTKWLPTDDYQLAAASLDREEG